MNFRDRYKYNPSSDKLGSGGFATVFKAEDTLLDREVALKIFHTSENSKVNLLSELKRMSRLDHPNLIRCLDILNVEITNIHGQPETLSIGVMEYANFGSLKEFAQRNNDINTSKNILIQILQGMSYLHQKGIIHRDLKPQNILLSINEGDLVPKITDFGISKTLSNDSMASSVVMGTIEYMAPEQFNPERYGINGRISTNLDLWSFGILTYELIAKKNLFGDGERNSSSEQVMNAILSFKLPDDIELLPEPFQSVIRRCLIADANNRVKEPKELISLLQRPASDFSKPVLKGYEGKTVVFQKEVKKETVPPVIEKPIERPRQPIPAPNYVEQNNLIEDGPIEENETSDKKKKTLPWIAAAIVIILAAGGFYFYTSSAKSTTNAVLTDKSEISDTSSTAPQTITWEEKIKESKRTNPSNKDKLLEIYLECSIDGVAECSYQAAMIFLEKKIYSSVLELTKRAVEKNHIKAISLYAYLYYTGTGITKDIAKAKELYEQAAAGNNSVALLMLGRMHKNGIEVKKDIALAKKYFLRAIEVNDDAEGVKTARKELENM